MSSPSLQVGEVLELLTPLSDLESFLDL